MSLEADLVAAEREGRRAWKRRDELAYAIAREKFGYDLPAVHKFTEDGVVYELDVFVSLRRVGRDDD